MKMYPVPEKTEATAGMWRYAKAGIKIVLIVVLGVLMKKYDKKAI